MPTIKEVAQRAGVSTCTVSNVLNNKRPVKPETKARVESAAAELRYKPSGVARSLKASRTLTLGMVVTTSTNPFYAEVLQAVEQRCYELGYSLIIANTRGNSERLKEALEVLRERQVDGTILMCTQVNPALHLSKDDLVMPVVVADWGITNLNVDLIQEEGRRGGYLAARHLLDLGHQAIGVLRGPSGKRTADERYSGFCDALQEAGVELRKDWVAEGDFELAGGYLGAQTILKAKQRPTAIIAGNDMMAAGALKALQEVGLRVPDDMSLIGYDNIELSSYLVPSLSTIEQPKERLGANAVDLLLDRIKNPDSPLRTITLEPHLIARQSTLPLNQR